MVMGILAVPRVVVNQRVSNLVVCGWECMLFRTMVLRFAMDHTSERFLSFLTCQFSVRNGTSAIFRRFVQLFRRRRYGIRHFLRASAAVARYTILPARDPLKEHVVRVGKVEIQRARGGAPRQVANFVVLFRHVEGTFSYVLHPFGTVQVCLHTVFVMCLRPIANGMYHVPTMDESGLFPSGALKGVPV